MIRQLQRLLRKNHIRISVAACLVMVTGILWTSPVFATSYGSNQYGTCLYQTCTVTTPTTVQTNITDGQIISPNGYTITVQLLGAASPLSSASFYVNGTLAQTQTADSTGTVQWFWKPAQLGSYELKILATTQDGTTVAQGYHVEVAPAATGHATKQSNLSFLQILEQAPVMLLQTGEQAIRQLPPQVKYGVPYFLFLLLIGDIFFLLLHIRREAAESHYLNDLLKREQQIWDLKKTFLALVSHYLRTPFTIIKSGIDLLQSIDKTAGPRIANLQADIQQLGDRINQLLEQSAGQVILAEQNNQADRPKTLSLWRQPILLVPVLLIGVLAFAFDYLAEHAGSFNVHQINLLIQVIIFASCAMFLYSVTRQLLLHRRNNEVKKAILAEQVSFNAGRDAFIALTAKELSGLVANLKTHVKDAGQTPATKFLEQGSTQLVTVVDKFVVASRLQGSSSAAQVAATKLSEICASALTNLDEKAKAKHVTINIAGDTSFQTRSAELLSVVMQTIIDNAVDYSPSSGVVDIEAVPQDDAVVISVTDHGPGIPEDKQYNLFQAFARVEGAEVFNREGMGFSLYLDRLIMFYLHGDISITSVKPQGTRVTVTLPTLPAEA